MSVTLITTGGGISGGPITTTGTLTLLPPVGGNLGGVKQGANVVIGYDGSISVAAPNPGTITGVTVGAGLLGGGTSGTVTVEVNFATGAEVLDGSVNFKSISPSTLSAKVGSLVNSGFVQLSDAYLVPDSTRAATTTAVNSVYSVANAALPRSGGTMTGPVIFAAGQTYSGIIFPVATPLSTGVISAGPGLNVNGTGVLTTVNNGTVTAITSGIGLGSPATGNIITSTGTIKLLPPTTDGLTIGGVKAGSNINIDSTGLISADGFLLTNNPYSYNSYIWPIPAVPPAAPGQNGSVLTLLDKVTGELGWTGTGTLTTVSAGVGINVVSTSTSATISLANTTIIPATYGATGLIPTFTVNNRGQITSAGQANPYPPFQNATISAPPDLVLDFTDNNTNWEYTLQGNTVFQAPTNSESGQTGMLVISQNILTPFVLTWASNWKWPGFTPIPLTPVAGAVDIFQFTVVSPTYIVITNTQQNIG